MRVSPLEAHRIWAETYDADLNPVLALEFRTLRDMLPDLRGRLFFDAGCGTGRWLAEARSRGAKVAGADACREMLLKAASKPGLAGTLLEADLCRLPLPAACADVVLCAFCLSYVGSLREAVSELARVVKPQGIVITTDLHPMARARGWTRSFRSGPDVFEIDDCPYTTGDLLEAARAAGLEPQEMMEPCFDEPEREIFRRAGKEHLFEDARRTPAVLISRWRRRA